jgi:hypothetical protein
MTQIHAFPVQPGSPPLHRATGDGSRAVAARFLATSASYLNIQYEDGRATRAEHGLTPPPKDATAAYRTEVQ